MKEDKKTQNVLSKGTAVIHFGILGGEFDNNCDPGAAWPYWKCDLRVYLNVFSMGKVETYTTLILKEITARFERDHSFDRGYWRTQEVDISDTRSYQEYDNTATISRSPMYNYTTTYFTQEYGLCFIVMDIDIGDNAVLMTRCYAVLTIYRNSTDVTRSKDDGFLWNKNYLDTITNVHCAKDYYQLSCWLKCVNTTEKFTCKSDGGERCLSFWEEIKFNYWYLHPDISHTILTRVNVYVSKCLIWNPCHFRMAKIVKHCIKPHELCYPIYNATFTCSKFDPIYILSTYNGANFTYMSVVNTEIVKLDMKLSGPHGELLRDNSYCFWVNTDYNSNTDFDCHTIPNVLFFNLNSRNKRFHFEIRCWIGTFRFFMFRQDFVVHIKPTHLSIHNLTYGNGEYLYLGQVITCYSDAIPPNSTKHVLNLQSNNFKVLPNRKDLSKIEIPYTARLGFCSLNCSFTFVFWDRRPYKTHFEYFKFDIKTFIYFSWNKPNKNVYFTDEYAGCDYLAYFHGILRVNQVAGPVKINTEPVRKFSTNTSLGGLYVFQCFLTSKMSIFTFFKVNIIEIFRMPSSICLLLNLPYPGSYLHCGHDGYPKDQGTFLIKIKKSDTLISQSTKSYVQIPYYLSHSVLTFSCQITYFIQSLNVRIQMQKTITMSKASQAILDYTDDDIFCAHIIDIPIHNAKEFGSGRIIIYSEIIFLDTHNYYSEFSFKCILAIIIFCTLFSFICVFGFLYKTRLDSLVFIRCNIWKRNINDKLIYVAQLAIDDTMDLIGVFEQRKKTVSEFSPTDYINSIYKKI